MKAKIAALTVAALVSAPAFAQHNATQIFEQQVFAAHAPVNAVELSQTEMKETEGELAPWAVGAIIGGGWEGIQYAYGAYKGDYKWDTGKFAGNVTKGAVVGGTLGLGGGAAAARTIGPIKHWVRIGGKSYSHSQKTHTYALRWGTNKHYAKEIPNQTARNLNQALRNTKLPGSSWRVQDKGHFHFKKIEK
ncbi:hypothetical protein [Conchiformibius kuhniae]|uniref:Uncharacterized protein n=1 Tax=Conchiformibius kuhniae TaxID=211502 RepID=A0A8T9MSV4_9NEIS|nr:hypothetical protein [Conchiformibius kuhniae]UOP04687.1 hypothetical protein LVJ77_10915 [Conchiformibius kuhniae]